MTGAGKSWRSWLRVHPAAELFPPLDSDELRALAADIKKNGQRGYAHAVSRNSGANSRRNQQAAATNGDYQMKERTLRETKAMDRMRTGSRLVHMHARGGRNWFVVPGGAVTDEVATKIRSHPSVVASEDGLFPGLSQTWRMRSFVGSDGPDAP